MKAWLLSGFQKERIFTKVKLLKAELCEQQRCIECMSVQIKMLSDTLHERQERVHQARELLISMTHALAYGSEGPDLADKVSRFIEEETE